MTTAVIVQARVGSTRLPGKVLKPLGTHTVLEEVLRRCRAIKGSDVTVCAIPDRREDMALIPVAERAGAIVVRGPEDDVLARYTVAAEAVHADVLMRVTSDCPLIDSEVCDAVLALRNSENADYAANNMPRSFPVGLDCEAFTFAVIAEACRSARDPYDREHVTPWLRRAPHLKRANFTSGDPSLARHRWTLDYPEDLTFFRAVFAALPAGSCGRMQDVLSVIAESPQIVEINARHRQPAA
jgi:spore coat polysaccharide biosynthesis protein SpsF